MAEGEFALVREHGEAALTRSSQGWAAVGDHDLYSLLADAAAQQRNEAALRKYAPLAEEFASRYDHKLYRAIALRAQGVAHLLAGEYNDAESSLDQALGLFGELSTRYQIGQTLFELGEVAAAQKDKNKAREYFTGALNDFERIGAAPDAIRVRERLAAL